MSWWKNYERKKSSMEQDNHDDYIEKETLINRYGIVEKTDIVDIFELVVQPKSEE